MTFTDRRKPFIIDIELFNISEAHRFYVTADIPG